MLNYVNCHPGVLLRTLYILSHRGRAPSIIAIKHPERIKVSETECFFETKYDPNIAKMYQIAYSGLTFSGSVTSRPPLYAVTQLGPPPKKTPTPGATNLRYANVQGFYNTNNKKFRHI